MITSSSSEEDMEMALSLANAGLALNACSRSDSDDNLIVTGLLSAASGLLQLAGTKRKRKCWEQPSKKCRNISGSFQFLTRELKAEDSDAYRNYLRMNEDTFKRLLSSVEKDLKHQNTIMRDSVEPAERLAITLRFLATGESYQSMQFQTRLSKAFLSINIPIICEILWQNLKENYLKFPSSIAEWEKISEEFAVRWQFPHCLGALDGKHIVFRSLQKDGGFYRNYKGTDSIFLLALCDASSKFTYVDIGCNGCTDDAGVLLQSKIKRVIDNGEQYFPAEKVIGNNRLLPYVIIGDDAFPLQKHIMKPYPYKAKEEVKQTFNSRISRARQNIDRAFGLLSNRFRVLQNSMNLRVDNVESVTKACCVLHNFLITHNSRDYLENNNSNGHSVTGDEQNQQEPQEQATSSRCFAETIREQFAEYFYNEGKIYWDDG